MSNAVKRLLALQEWDQQVADLRKEKVDVPLRRQMIEERLSEHRAALELAKATQTQHALRIRELDGDVETFKTRLRKYREQQLRVKNNDEYWALGQEITSTERSIRKVEDQELEVMAAQQEVDRTVEELEAELARETELAAEELRALDARIVAIEEQLSRFQTGREGLLEGIPPEWVSRYERIFQHFGKGAIVAVKNGSCSGCHMRLPPHLIHDARKPGSLTFCSYCGRILNGTG